MTKLRRAYFLSIAILIPVYAIAAVALIYTIVNLIMNPSLNSIVLFGLAIGFTYVAFMDATKMVTEYAIRVVNKE